MIRAGLIVIAALALAGCGGVEGAGGTRVASASTRTAPVTRVRPPAHTPPPNAQVRMAPGLEGVIGASSAQLVRSFGPARLDVIEGDAHKLQFLGAACVLDVYLYPASAGREPEATYVDARRPSDGRDVDPVTMVAA